MIRKLGLKLTIDFDAGTLYAEVNENLGIEAGTLLLNRGLKVEKKPRSSSHRKSRGSKALKSSGPTS